MSNRPAKLRGNTGLNAFLALVIATPLAAVYVVVFAAIGVFLSDKWKMCGVADVYGCAAKTYDLIPASILAWLAFAAILGGLLLACHGVSKKFYEDWAVKKLQANIARHAAACDKPDMSVRSSDVSVLEPKADILLGEEDGNVQNASALAAVAMLAMVTLVVIVSFRQRR